MAVTDLECTGHHEAAHAVLYVVQGIEIEDLTLTSSGGWCFPSTDAPYDYPYLLAALAGRESDRHLLADQPDDLKGREPGWKGDLGQVDKAVAELGGNVDLDAASAESRRLVLANWSKIQAIAQLLLRGLNANLQEADIDSYTMQGYDVTARVTAMP
jgi:hypothetical protein